MKKRKKWYRILSFVLTVAMLAGFCPQGVSFKGMQLTTPKAEAADAISNPKIEKVTSMNNTWKTTWDCVWFGSYPQSEITSEDGDIYHELKNVTGWDENNDIVIGKAKYRRLKATEATNYATRTGETHPSYYNWKTDYNTYHYFKYEPIKWRVLNRDNNNNVFLVADISLDD